MFTHESTSFLDCVIEGNEGTVPFIPYRALHSGRNALIGPISSSFAPISAVRGRVVSSDWTTPDEMAFVVATPDHIDVALTPRSALRVACRSASASASASIQL